MNQKPNPHSLNGGESVSKTIRCAYCLDPFTVELHPSIIERYGSDYEPSRCAPCDYLKTRRLQQFHAAIDPDATLPAFSSLSEPEIDAALTGLEV